MNWRFEMQMATLGAGAIALCLSLNSCGKKDVPSPSNSCNSGQVLTYTDNSGYQCQNSYANGQTYPFSNYGLVAPVGGCQDSNQILINWNNAWVCYKPETLAKMPTGQQPPQGLGGEYCNTIKGAIGQAPAYPGFAGIICGANYECRFSQAPTNTSATPQNGICIANYGYGYGYGYGY